ncbi:MAG: hypothetical protein J0M11_19890 [Anaerolineae bacterium]|nr:hypothetical protein [Anaerolineae bacterium]
MSKKALTFGLLFGVAWSFSIMNGNGNNYLLFSSLLLLALTFRDFWANVVAWFMYAFIKVLPARWATEKRKKGYSNYGKG